MPLHASVELHHVSGIPRNSVINTFSFSTAVDFATEVEIDAVCSALQEFYMTPGTLGGSGLANKLSDSISRTVKPTIRVYDLLGTLDGTPHGSPVRIQDFTVNLTAPSDADGLPTEVCAALSFHSDYGPAVEFGAGTRPRARDRGRIFFGPLTKAALQDDAVNGRVVVSDILKAALAGAGGALRGDASTNWCVWSRVNAELTPVTSVWVDDAFDTQRRRGTLSMARTTA